MNLNYNIQNGGTPFNPKPRHIQLQKAATKTDTLQEPFIAWPMRDTISDLITDTYV